MIDTAVAGDVRDDAAGAAPDETEEAGLVLGRPVEDRSFEMVEAGVRLAAGIAIGTAVAGPIAARGRRVDRGGGGHRRRRGRRAGSRSGGHDDRRQRAGVPRHA